MKHNEEDPMNITADSDRGTQSKRSQQINEFRESNLRDNSSRQRKAELKSELEINMIQGRLLELSKRKSA